MALVNDPVVTRVFGTDISGHFQQGARINTAIAQISTKMEQ